jgi:hypothetical protein
MSSHRIFVAGLVVLGWLATCAAVAEAQKDAPGAKTVAIPDFRLSVPPGDWAVERDVANAHVTLIEHAVSRLGPRVDVRIDVRTVRPDPARGLAPAAAARKALDAELNGLRDRARGGWTYTGAARDTTVGCRILVGERYRLRPPPRGSMVGDEEGTVFAWVPPDYAKHGRVFLFRLTMVTHGAQGVRVRSESPFFDVIQRLEVQSAPEGIIC